MTKTQVSKHLLLSVTGMSPAVVTETLYGIAQRIKEGDSNAHWPNEICIITTSKGKGEMVSRLVSGDWLRQVCEAVGQPVIAMADEHILVVPGANGLDVDDARSEEDHEALANFITRSVRDFTSDDNLQIHASIAGGRKTMTFYLGYAMSLFGRHFDRMSHVLISEGFESARGFYFPGQQPYRLETGPKVLDTRNAEVTLADIPFIRMRHSLPNILKKNSKDNLEYQKLVNLINAGDAIEGLSLTAKFHEGELIIAKDGVELETVSFKNKMHWAFYCEMIRDSSRYSGDRMDYQRPAKEGVDEVDTFYSVTASSVLDLLGVESDGREFREQLIDILENQIDGLNTDSIYKYGELRKSIASFINIKLPSKKDQESADKKGEYISLRERVNGKPLPGGAFDSFIQGIYKTLREKLPDNLAEILKPALRNTGLDVDPDEHDSVLDDKAKSYLLGVKPDQITLI